MSNRLHYPSEIFGYPPSNRSSEANKVRANYECPFLQRKCTKQTRMLPYPLGICSVWHKDKPRIICPQRFYFNDYQLLKRVSKDFLNVSEDSIKLVPEVKLKDFGDVDWVGYTISDDVVSFVGIEIMADSTTQTGALVEALKDFLDSGKIKKRYNYGLNTYNTIKLSYTQMLVKGQVFERWGRYYIWILQDVLLSELSSRFDLTLERGIVKGNWIIFASIKMSLNEDSDTYELVLSDYYSTSVDKLLRAYTRMDIPDEKEFIQTFLKKDALDVSKNSGTVKLGDFM